MKNVVKVGSGNSASLEPTSEKGNKLSDNFFLLLASLYVPMILF